MQGTVTKRGVSKNGKPTLHVDGKLYFAGKCNVSELSVGDRIDFEAHAFSDDGQLWTIDKWGKLPAGNGTARAPDSWDQEYARQTATTPTGSQGEPLSTKDACIFICGVVNNAITAGRIQEPQDIEVWVSAARNAIRGQL